MTPSFPHKDTLFFDLFETLVDPAPLTERHRWLTEQGIDPHDPVFRWLEAGCAQALYAADLGVPVAVVRDFFLLHDVAADSEAMAAALIGHLGGGAISAQTLAFTAAYTDWLIDQVTLDPDAKTVLGRLHADGYRLCLISNLMPPYRLLIERFRLHAFFQELILSCAVGAVKPDPAIYERALHMMGVTPSQTAMIGDNWRSDVQGALAAGITPIYVDRSSAGVADPAVLRVERLIDLLPVLQKD